MAEFHTAFNANYDNAICYGFKEAVNIMKKNGIKDMGLYVPSKASFSPSQYKDIYPDFEKFMEGVAKKRKGSFLCEGHQINVYLIYESKIASLDRGGFNGGLALFQFNSNKFVKEEIDILNQKKILKDSVYIPCYQNELNDYLNEFKSSSQV